MSSARPTSTPSLPEGSGPLNDLVDTVQLLWPGASVRVDREPGAADWSLGLAPSARAPRMLIPTDRRAASAAMMRFSTALTLRESVIRVVAARGMRFLGPSRVTSGHFITLRGAEGSLLAHLTDIFGQKVSVSITIGNARANRKPVLQIFGPDGTSLAYAKLGITDEARALVAAEADALGQVSSGLKGFELPRLIRYDAWQGYPLLVMSALDTRPQLLHRETKVPLSKMASFSLQLGHRSAPLSNVPQWRRIRRSLGNQDALGMGDLLSEIERLAQTLPDSVVGTWHGDWTAWNMAKRGKRVQLWDLERLESGVVHGLDGFHYCVNDATLRGGQSVEVIHGGIRVAASAMGGGASVGLIGAVYLAAIAERYLGSVSSDLGHLIEERAVHVVEALRRWLPEITKRI